MQEISCSSAVLTWGHGSLVVTADSDTITTVQDISPLPDKGVLGVLRVLRNEGQYKFHFSLIGVIVTIVISHGI